MEVEAAFTAAWKAAGLPLDALQLQQRAQHLQAGKHAAQQQSARRQQQAVQQQAAKQQGSRASRKRKAPDSASDGHEEAGSPRSCGESCMPCALSLGHQRPHYRQSLSTQMSPGQIDPKCS